MDTALFPKRPDDFIPITVTPVICRPIMGAVDQFVVAALCSGRGKHLLVLASIKTAVRQLYRQQAEGILVGIDIALTDLSDASSKLGFSVEAYLPAVSTIFLGEADRTEGSDLGATGERWLQSMSSLHRPLSEEAQASEENETDVLRRRLDELESLAEHPDPGLWRFWNRKAAELASKLQAAQDELRLTRATEEAALAMIGIDRSQEFKQGYIQETYALEYLDQHADRVRATVLRELGFPNPADRSGS